MGRRTEDRGLKLEILNFEIRNGAEDGGPGVEARNLKFEIRNGADEGGPMERADGNEAGLEADSNTVEPTGFVPVMFAGTGEGANIQNEIERTAGAIGNETSGEVGTRGTREEETSGRGKARNLKSEIRKGADDGGPGAEARNLKSEIRNAADDGGPGAEARNLKSEIRKGGR